MFTILSRFSLGIGFQSFRRKHTTHDTCILITLKTKLCYWGHTIPRVICYAFKFQYMIGNYSSFIKVKQIFGFIFLYIVLIFILPHHPRMSLIKFYLTIVFNIFTHIFYSNLPRMILFTLDPYSLS